MNRLLLVLLSALAVCALLAAPELAHAQESSAITCADGIDNDGDAAIDCCDTSCFGIGSCAAALCPTGDATCDQDGDGDLGEPGTQGCNTCVCDLDGDGTDDCEAAVADSDGDGLCDNADSEACDGIDNDGDGVIDNGFDVDGDGVTSCGPDGDALLTADNDCDDTDALNFPGNAEVCDAQDNDCDGLVDNGLTDADGDGFSTCDVDGDGLPDDCDDGDPTVNQGAAEVCDTIDNDCSGVADDNLPDLDGDGFVACDLDGDGFLDDCDDTTALSNQAATELCDGYDNDCNGIADFVGGGGDELDADGDGFVGCGGFTDTDGAGGIVGGEDCEDNAASANPFGTEVCDGYDNDCSGTAGFTDFSGDELDGDSDGYLTCLILVGDLHPDIVGDGDCDDTNATVNPGATELCDYDDVDNDCDGISDFLETFTAAELSVLPDTDLDGTPDCQDADADNDGFVRPGDCDDRDETTFPGNAETCEDEDQIDSDCDGSVDTASDGSDPIGNVISRFVDADRDGFGAGLTILFCEEPDAEPCDTGVGICYAFVAGDCNDADASRNPDAPEVCNGIDEDCDGDIDDLGDDPENPIPPQGCRSMKRDLDGDGIGDQDNALCLCLVGNDTEAVYGGDTYVLPGGDCDDEDANTHPAFTSGDGFEIDAAEERQDGNDNDCDGLLFAIELDCDDDGSLAKVPRPGASPLTADELRLQECTIGGTRELSCWDDTTLTLSCDLEEVDDGAGGTALDGSGLWVLRYGESEDAYGGRFDGGARVYPTAPACSQVGDCDDHCPLRCADQDEVCDGIDNDCSGIADRQLADSLPDSMVDSARLAGIIEVAEGDLDRDGYLDCDNFTGGSAFEFTYSDLSCDEVIADETLLTDCSPACTFANPAAVEVCNGFTDLCGGELEGTDGDGDGHRTCGAWSDPTAGDAEGIEQVFAVVWKAGATFTGTDVPDAIPLIPPRVPGCDTAEGCDAPITCDLLLNDALAWLLDPAATDGGDAMSDADAAVATELIAALRSGRATATEIVQAVCAAPDDRIGQIEQRTPRAQEGSCGIVQLTLSSTVDTDLDEILLEAATAMVETNVFEVDFAAEGLEESKVTPLRRAETCLRNNPEQFVARTVWNEDRSVDVRRSVAEWECIRLYDGARSCADVEPVTELRETWESMVDVTDAVTDTLMWTQELGNFSPVGLTQGTVMKCWGDLTREADLAERIGGDCSDGTVAASRDEAEGPWDLRALYDLTIADTELSCARCLDGIDNNCDGQIDCEDPSCAPCFVGVGGGCYATNSPCAAGSCGGDVVRSRAAEPGALLFGLALIALVGRRRKQ